MPVPLDAELELIRRSLVMAPSLGADQACRLIDEVYRLLAELARRDEQGCCQEDERRSR